MLLGGGNASPSSRGSATVSALSEHVLVWIAVMLMSVQHCDGKTHQNLVAEPSFYRSLDDLIASSGLQLTRDKFMTPLSIEPTQNRHDIFTSAATCRLCFTYP